MSACINAVLGGAVQKTSKGYPTYYLGVVNGKIVTVSYRRLILERHLGKPVSVATGRCGNKMCVNPEHLYATSLRTMNQDRKNEVAV